MPGWGRSLLGSKGAVPYLPCDFQSSLSCRTSWDHFPTPYTVPDCLHEFFPQKKIFQEAEDQGFLRNMPSLLITFWNKAGCIALQTEADDSLFSFSFPVLCFFSSRLSSELLQIPGTGVYSSHPASRASLLLPNAAPSKLRKPRHLLNVCLGIFRSSVIPTVYSVGEASMSALPER